MPANRFGYQMQKFSEARSALLVPLLQGEDEAFGLARVACSLGLNTLNLEHVEEEGMRRHLQTVQDLLNVDSRPMTLEEKRRFSSAVDHLANWFAMEHWSGA